MEPLFTCKANEEAVLAARASDIGESFLFQKDLFFNQKKGIEWLKPSPKFTQLKDHKQVAY